MLDAARKLGVSDQTVRNWLQTGDLEGHKASNGRWAVQNADVQRRLAKFGRKKRGVGDLGPLAAEVRRLAEAVEELRQERAPVSPAEVELLMKDRDRYRTDAATMREAAFHLNSAAGEAYDAMKQTLSVLEAQREALAQLLGPGSPEDLVR